MGRLTKWDENHLLVREEERLLNSYGIITKDEMYKIMRHLAEKLAKYEDAEEQGLLLKPPCKIGDPVWVFTNNKILEYKVARLIIDISGLKYIQAVKEVMGEDFWCNITLEEIGKTVFFTMEDAEQKKEEQG